MSVTPPFTVIVFPPLDSIIITVKSEMWVCHYEAEKLLTLGPNNHNHHQLKPTFHWKWGSHWVPNANEIYTKNIKCTWPTPVFCVWTQRKLYSTDWRRGLASGKTQILALGNAKIYQHVVNSNAKFWRWGALPNANPRRQVFCVAVEYRLYCT